MQIIEKFPRSRQNLIPVLQAIQKEQNYLNREAVSAVAEYLGLGVAQVYGAASFYTQFRLKKTGKNIIKICKGTACHVSGADNIIDAVERTLGIRKGETTADGKFSIEEVACLGCCSLAPVLMINDRVYARLVSSEVKKILQSYS
ncbi:MAG TPA: NADH-quinone oxidoreductase subunit NuoE [Spirochaetia bacterium]|nr:NADH-quinone oxidoreductase subunit NuoE [Spirochaetia bacterium]